MAREPIVDRRAERSFRRALAESAYLYEAIQTMLVEVLTAEHGSHVTAAAVNKTFPELRASFDGSIPTLDLAQRVDEYHDAEEIAEGIVFPDELPKPFWQRLGMTMHRNVVVIHSATRAHHSDLHLLTDGKRDWFFHYWVTSFCLDEYAIGPPTRATRAGRKKEALAFACNPREWISEPGHLTTSLTRDDLQCLRSAQDLPVHYQRGSLSRL